MASITSPAPAPISSRSPLSRPVTLAVIVGNRGFFPHHLASKGREIILQVLAKAGIRAIITPENATDHGAIESLKESQLCAELFRQHRDEIDGVLVTLPNFGDERAIANTLRFAGLDVPVLVHAFPDAVDKMLMGARRDSFCGKMSVCNNLWQYGIKFSLTAQHTVAPASEAFKADLAAFAATCRIVRGLKDTRVGAIGARPAAFNTVRFSEKLMENHGITVETLDLSEVIGRVGRMKDDDERVTGKLSSIHGYVDTRGIPPGSLLKMAKFGAVVDGWIKDN